MVDEYPAARTAVIGRLPSSRPDTDDDSAIPAWLLSPYTCDDGVLNWLDGGRTAELF